MPRNITLTRSMSESGSLDTTRKRVTCLYDVEQYSDITVTFGDCKIFAHKAILAASSMFFHRAFSSGFAVRTRGVFS
jgi:hypothetical protein